MTQNNVVKEKVCHEMVVWIFTIAQLGNANSGLHPLIHSRESRVWS